MEKSWNCVCFFNFCGNTISGAVVGSLEILGNPTGLVRSIGTC